MNSNSSNKEAALQQPYYNTPALVWQQHDSNNNYIYLYHNPETTALHQ